MDEMNEQNGQMNEVRRIEMDKIVNLEKCEICPHKCGVNRYESVGRCKSSANVKIALASLHYFEEPCISGEEGSGTIFFSNCNLNCIFCQNYEISQEGYGREITIDELANIMLELQDKNANNINLVTPTSYVYQIIEAIKIARSRGLKIPIVYNTNSYERVENIRALNGYVDIYLPDLKYFSNDIAKKYSKIDNYFENATKVIKEMQDQIGEAKFDERGIMKKGVIIRHLILPSYPQNSKNILKWIKNNMPEDVYVSVMAQYFPTYKAKEDEKINRKITKKEYENVARYFFSLNIKNGFIQELGDHEEEYVPNFKEIK